MPELAEVETFRRQLEPLLLGNTIESIELFHPRITRRHPNKKIFIKEVEGATVKKVSRYGKYLILELSPVSFLNIHLRMSGRFLVFDSENFEISMLPKHSHVVIYTKEKVVAYIDPRTFGEFWLTKSRTPEIDKGIDAFDSSQYQLYEKLSQYALSKRPIKTILLDQSVVSGIGNIYADEICANAQVLPTKRTCDLSDSENSKIVKSIKSVLQSAIDDRGSSLKDESFRDLYGNVGQYQNKHLVHARKTCSKCGSEIGKTKLAGRSTYFCRHCQG